jgi:hypothetical protein
MVHVAAAQFYDEISKDLERFDYILHEGVSWRRNAKDKPIHDWAAKNLGLVTQKRFLKFPEGIPKINIDMPCPEFRERFLNLPIFNRLLFRILRPFLWLISKSPAAKEVMMNSLATMEAKKHTAKAFRRIEELVLKERDQHICSQLHIFAKDHFNVDNQTHAAIVFGARHMASISDCLQELRYKPESKKWLELIRSERNNAGE